MGDDDAVQEALDVLLDPALDDIVEVVLLQREGRFEAHAVDGSVRFARDERGGHDVVEERGRNPLGDQSTDRFAGLAEERANLYPDRTRNAYPFAYEQVAQLFDAASPPDLCVVHTAAHNWEDRGGHRGEHGSLDAVQARAPFVLAGAGVRQLGRVPRACRLVDIAPTVAALLGAQPFRNPDGEVLEDLIDERERKPRHVVGFLLDGVNPNVLYEMADHGEAPNVAQIMATGTTFEHGAMASLPTVTLANHTSILTAAHPGHHGILHNAWYDRASGRQVITNSPATWVAAMEWLDPRSETLHDVVHHMWPAAVTVSINEPCDSGADYSVFQLLRKGEMPDHPPEAEELPHATESFVRPYKDYRWSSRIDHTAVDQAVAIWSGRYRGVDYPTPTFTWVNFTVTDAAFHAGGPHSEIARASVRDTDARIGEVLAAVEASGAFDQTAFFVVADHGMEETNPAVRGDWDDALLDAGIKFRDEGYGFIYLGV